MIGQTVTVTAILKLIIISLFRQLMDSEPEYQQQDYFNFYPACGTSCNQFHQVRWKDHEQWINMDLTKTSKQARNPDWRYLSSIDVRVVSHFSHFITKCLVFFFEAWNRSFHDFWAPSTLGGKLDKNNSKFIGFCSTFSYCDSAPICLIFVENITLERYLSCHYEEIFKQNVHLPWYRPFSLNLQLN